MATIWNGESMLENLTDDEAKKMLDADKGQWIEQHDGSALKYRSEFTGYKNKAMKTKVSDKPAQKATVKKSPAKKAPAKKTTSKDKK